MLRPTRICRLLSSRRLSSQPTPRATPTCLPELSEALQQVDDEVLVSLDELRQLNSFPLWGEGFDSIKRIATAPSRHMISSQLLLLSHVHDLPRDKLTPTMADDVIVATASVELLHLFMLIQDDVMDNSIVRRGTSTVHHHLRGRLLATEGTVTGRIAESYAAVLADCVHATAHAVLATTSNSPALETFHAMALSAAQYQFQDLMGWKQHADNTEAVTQAVEDVVALSSTLRFSYPLKMGQCFSAHDLPPAAMEWAQHFGRAFKLLGDVSDVVSDPFVSGKDPLRNLEEGRLSSVIPAMLRSEHAAAILTLDSPAWSSLGPNPLLRALLASQAVERVLEDSHAALQQATTVLAELDPKLCLHAGLTNFTAGLQHHHGVLHGRFDALQREFEGL